MFRYWILALDWREILSITEFGVLVMIRMLLTAALVLNALTIPTPALAADQDCEQCLGGSLQAPIRIEVFSDFQCTSCRSLYMDTIKRVLKDYCSADKVCVIYHEFPHAAHPFARAAARYSLVAQKLGRQPWLAVFDTLYADQAIWSWNGKVQATVAKALSPADFWELQQQVQDPSIDEMLKREIALGRKREVKLTPTFFVTALGKERKVVGVLPYHVLKEFFDRIAK